MTSHEDRFLLDSDPKKSLDFNGGCSSQSSRNFPLLIFHQDDNKITHQHRFSAACILTACTQCLQRTPLGASLREVGENLGDFCDVFFTKMDQTLHGQSTRNSPLGVPLIKNLKEILISGGGVLSLGGVGQTDQG